MSQKYIKFRIQKRRRRASVSCLRGPPTVSLCGDWLWRGQACRQPRKCQRNQPDSSSASRGHVTCLGLTAIICQTVRITTLFSFPPIPPPPHPPQFFFSPPSGWNVSTHFSLYALCLTDVGERSLWWCCAGEMSRNVRELLMSCNSEKHLCVGMTFKNLSSCKISQNVCTSLFLQIIYSNYLRSVCPNIHISIFVWRFQIVKNVRFEPQLQANSPKPFVLFFFSPKCQIRICRTPRPKPVLTYTTVCQHYQVLRLVGFSSGRHKGLSYICCLKQTIYWERNLSSKIYFILLQPFQPMKIREFWFISSNRFVSVYHSCHETKKMGKIS